MTGTDIVRRLRTQGLSDGELAARAGVARETVSRWATGAQRPSLEALEKLAAAAGWQLELRLVPADPEHVALVHDQLDHSPTDRLKALLGTRWRACRDALRAAAAIAELGVLVGPVAAALQGAPQRPGAGRVDVLIAPPDVEDAFERLLGRGAHPDGIEAAGDERRERWVFARGVLTLRSRATGVASIGDLRDRSQPVLPNREDVGVVYVPLVEDLLEIAQHSPWSEDAIYRSGLRAVLASGRYSSRDARRSHLR